MAPEQIDTVNTTFKGASYEPLDGGVKAWLCGIFQLYYQTTLLPHQSASSLAQITTLQVFLKFVFGPPVGFMIDAIGPRRILIPFSLLCVFSIFMLSLCTEYWEVVLAQGVAFGTGAAGLSLPALVLTSQRFSTKRGLATGIVSSGSSFDGIIYPIMVSRLIESHGFPAAVHWTGLLVGCCIAVGNLFAASPFKPKGFQERPAKNFAAFKSLPWISSWVLFAPLNYLPEMAAQNGMSIDLVYYTITVANVGSAFGRIIPDRFGIFNILTIVTFLSGAFTLAIWLPFEIYPSTAGFFIFGLIYGFVGGGSISLALPYVASLANGRFDNMGAMMGGLCFSIALGALTGLPILGAIKNVDGDRLRGVIVFSGCVLIFGAFLIGVARAAKFGGSLKLKF